MILKNQKIMQCYGFQKGNRYKDVISSQGSEKKIETCHAFGKVAVTHLHSWVERCTEMVN